MVKAIAQLCTGLIGKCQLHDVSILSSCEISCTEFCFSLTGVYVYTYTAVYIDLAVFYFISTSWHFMQDVDRSTIFASRGNTRSASLFLGVLLTEKW